MSKKQQHAYRLLRETAYTKTVKVVHKYIFNSAHNFAVRRAYLQIWKHSSLGWSATQHNTSKTANDLIRTNNQYKLFTVDEQIVLQKNQWEY